MNPLDVNYDARVWLFGLRRLCRPTTIIWLLHLRHLKSYCSTPSPWSLLCRRLIYVSVLIQNSDLILDISVCTRYLGLQSTWIVMVSSVGLGGLGVRCSPRDPRFAGSNPTEVDWFFQSVKIQSTCPPGETLSWGPESEISGSLKTSSTKK